MIRTVLTQGSFAFLALFILNSTLWAATSPRLSVTRFDQRVEHWMDGCGRWDWTHQDQLRTQLESELRRQGVQVLERESIRKILADEVELPNSDRRSAPRRGKFLTADYTVTGGVTELGICEESRSNSVQLGGLLGLVGVQPPVDLAVGGGSIKNRIKLTANLVRVETGEIIRSFEAEAEVEESRTRVRAGVAGIGGEHSARTSPAIERAAADAMRKLGEQIREAI